MLPVAVGGRRRQRGTRFKIQVLLGGGAALLCCVAYGSSGALVRWLPLGAAGPGPASRHLLSEVEDVVAGNSTVADACDDLTDFDNNGGLAVHLFGILYVFLGIAIICDDFFVESLERISAALNLSDDVAGATFMAAGSSAPELAVAVVATLFAPEPSDEGLGTIVGSAVFNIMIIVGVTAIGAGQTLDITPYPFARDCLFYTLSIGMLVAFVYDGEVTWWESLILLFGYVLYILFMTQNAKVAEWLERRKGNKKKRIAPAGSEAANTRVSQMPDFKAAMAKDTQMNPRFKPAYHASLDDEMAGYRAGARKKLVTVQQSAMTIMTVNRISKGWLEKAKTSSRLSTGAEGAAAAAEDGEAGSSAEGGKSKVEQNGTPVPPKEETKDEKKDDDEDDGPMGPVGKVLWFLSLPYKVLFLTVPDCRKPKLENFYMGTFIMSIVWIGILSYAMLYFSSRAGCIIGIPPIVMGTVIISAGTSVPDALSSIFVARNGQGDMAVSNVLGSNVFNIFLGLGLPWLLYTSIRGKTLKSPGLSADLVPSILILFGYLGILVVTMMAAGWKLFPKVGYMLICMHMFFVAYALLTNPIGDSDAVFEINLRR